MRTIALILLASLVTTCTPKPEVECTRTSECAPGELCRVRECVPIDNSTPNNESVTQPGGDVGGGDHDSGTESDDAAEDVPRSACPDAVVPASGGLVINEILANPPSDELGDANGDGVRDAYDDEFVELVNTTGVVLDLHGVQVKNGGDTKATIEMTCVEPDGGVVVFGGFSGVGRPALDEGVEAVVAQTRLGLANGGSTVSITRSDGTVIDELTYSDAPAESLTRSPQIEGSAFVPHSALDETRLHSAGLCADGEPIPTGCTTE